MADLGPESTIRQVLALGERGRQALYEHGYDVGTDFADVLSQHQSLRDAARSGRLRDAAGLIEALKDDAAEAGDSRAPAPR